jgi:hypothetical protein
MLFIVMPVHRNQLESGRGHFWNKTGECYTVLLFLQYLSTLFAGKMAHHRNILEIQKPEEVLS